MPSLLTVCEDSLECSLSGELPQQETYQAAALNSFRLPLLRSGKQRSSWSRHVGSERLFVATHRARLCDGWSCGNTGAASAEAAAASGQGLCPNILFLEQASKALLSFAGSQFFAKALLGDNYSLARWN